MLDSEILMLKLSSGEEIIGECAAIDGGIVVKDACTISTTVSKEGKHSVKFSLYCQYAEENAICVKSYVWVATPVSEIVAKFKSIFSPIILPESTIQLV